MTSPKGNKYAEGGALGSTRTLKTTRQAETAIPEWPPPFEKRFRLSPTRRTRYQAAATCSLSIWLAAPMKAFSELEMMSLLMATPL